MKKVEIQRRGAVLAVQELAEFFGPSLGESVPRLWETCHHTILNSDNLIHTDPQTVVNR